MKTELLRSLFALFPYQDDASASKFRKFTAINDADGKSAGTERSFGADEPEASVSRKADSSQPAG